jgi:hypothetical protein
MDYFVLFKKDSFFSSKIDKNKICCRYFASNSALQTGVEQLPQRLEDALDDLDLFFDNTVEQIDHLAGENFDQVSNRHFGRKVV